MKNPFYNPTFLFYPKLLRENICSPGISRRLVRCFSCGRVACNWWKDGIGGFFRGGNPVVYIYYWKLLPEFVFFVSEGIIMVGGCCRISLACPTFTWQWQSPGTNQKLFLWRIWKFPREHTDGTKHKTWENRKQWKPQSLATFLGD